MAVDLNLLGQLIVFARELQITFRFFLHPFKEVRRRKKVMEIGIPAVSAANTSLTAVASLL